MDHHGDIGGRHGICGCPYYILLCLGMVRRCHYIQVMETGSTAPPLYPTLIRPSNGKDTANLESTVFSGFSIDYSDNNSTGIIQII